MTKNDFLTKVGENIRRIRSENGITQAELAKRAGMHRQNMSRLEKGGHNPSAFLIYEIAKILKVDLSELMDFD